MFRQVARGVSVVMELDIQNRFTGEDLSSMNVIGEIPGTDKRDEIVMIGGHFDSWHQGTGATDNGCSCAVMVEAMRILKAANVPLRRTVRIGLWTGEEQGLIGSREYVAAHFAGRGPAPTPDPAVAAAGGGRGGGGRGGGPLIPRPDHAKFSVYFNQDNGCGAIRGVYTQGNEPAVAVFRDWFRHVDSDSISVRHITPANTGGTDHQSFDAVGLPGFQFIQDPMDYGTRTHHFSQDLYERLVPRDMMHNATTIATLVYLAANRNDLFPRKPAAPGGQQ
jgi:Zn-dependent M28 family amino/carboxypeptidase